MIITVKSDPVKAVLQNHFKIQSYPFSLYCGTEAQYQLQTMQLNTTDKK